MQRVHHSIKKMQKQLRYKKLELPEILGANIHEKIYRWPWLNKELAYVQLISKLLGVEFDAIWQRHKRLLEGILFRYLFWRKKSCISWRHSSSSTPPMHSALGCITCGA